MLAPAIPVPDKTRSMLALKSNLLLDAVLIPNIGTDISLGRGLSIGLDWHYAWWTDRDRLWWQTYGGMVHADWWPEHRRKDPLLGHRIGLYAQMFTYDFELGGKGEIASRWNHGGGLEYGYSFMISEHLNLELLMCLGILSGRYERYHPDDITGEVHHVWESTHYRHYVGPAMMQMNLVWVMDKKGKR